MSRPNGKEEFEDKKKSPAISSLEKKNGGKITPILPQSGCPDREADNRSADRIPPEVDLTDNSSPIRKKKVQEAKKKKQNGDYDSQEVYKKIADKLMDLFGI
ncbi:MAG: hypothetical protein KAW02_02480 [candidate division Zixibacteria bacterium]|nr:hypothetical protein [candidate division Zixibacteria bacterium]